MFHADNAHRFVVAMACLAAVALSGCGKKQTTLQLGEAQRELARTGLEIRYRHVPHDAAEADVIAGRAWSRDRSAHVDFAVVVQGSPSAHVSLPIVPYVQGSSYDGCQNVSWVDNGAYNSAGTPKRVQDARLQLGTDLYVAVIHTLSDKARCLT